MESKNYYKEQLWDHSTDELKDLVAGRFRIPADNELVAAMELLKERNKGNKTSELSLRDIPNASMAVLLEIIKNPDAWGESAVAVAEAEILRREQQPNTNNKSGTHPVLKGILAVLGVVATLVIIKVVAAIILMGFLFYAALSCLSNI